jgi:tetratricopeptide (TPR) repeat protein
MMTDTGSRKRTLFSLIITFILLISFTAPAWAQDSYREAIIDGTLLFKQANHFYEQGEFIKASKAYLQLATAGYESGNLYFNLGNTYFKMGQKGRAILYYEKAQRLIPNDTALKTNLVIALTGVDEGEINWSHEFFRSLAYLVPLDWLAIASSLIFFLVILGIIFVILIPTKIKDKNTGKIKFWYQSILIVTSFLLFVCISLTAFTYLDRIQAQAVVTKGGVAVLSKPDSEGTAYYQLAEGTRVLLNETKGEWCLIKRQDGKRGWVQWQSLERL